jgi:hypothetical protein
MIGLLRWLIPVISMILLIIPYKIIKKLNLKEREQRWKQLRFVYTSLMFGAVACTWAGTLSTALDKLLRREKIRELLDQLISSAIFEYALALFAAILSNAVLLIVFCVIKKLDKIGMKKRTLPADWNELIENKTPFPRYLYWALLNLIYGLDDKRFLLRKDLVKVKHTLKYFVKIITVLYLLAVAVLEIPLLYSATWIPFDLIQKVLNATYLWPAVSLIIICECFYYLDGKEEFEKDDRFKKEHAKKSVSADYSELEDKYKNIFKGRYIATLTPEDYSHKPRTGETSNSHPVVEGIKKGLRGQFEINHDYIKHIEKILDGKNVIIDASVYSEFGEYLFRYLNIVLAGGETVLIICPDEPEMKELRKHTEERLRSINSYHHLWEIGEYHTNYGVSAYDGDILFATPQITANDVALSKHFSDALSTVIISNAAESMARDNLQLSILSFKLAGMKNKKDAAVQYICLSESIPLGIRKSLAEVLQLPEHLTAGDTYRVYDNTKIMLWRYEDPNAPIAQDKLFPGRSPRYLGLSLPLACVALENGVDMVSVFSHAGTPHKQMLENINTIKHYLNSFFKSASVDFDTQIVFNRYNRENKYARFAVIDDDSFNLPMVIYNSARLGGKDTTMIHIVSKAYMLRDFFFANAETYLNSESHINMFIPGATDTSKLAVFRLLYEMHNNGLPEDDIIERVEELRPPGNSIKNAESPIRAALAYCMEKVSGNDAGDAIYRHFSFHKRTRFNAKIGDFSSYYLVRYAGNNAIGDLTDESSLATAVIGGKPFAMNFRSDDIYQRYLSGQHIVYDGRAYQIHSILNGQIQLKDSRDDCKLPAGYTQIRHYFVDNTVSRRDTVQGRKYDVTWDNMLEGFTVQLFQAPVEVQTLGYYVHSMTGDAFNHLLPVPIDGEPDMELREQAARKYPAANILDFKLQCKIGTDTDKVAFLMSVMMNEFCKTWFPYFKDCIAVCPVLRDPDAINNDELGKSIAKLYPQMSLAQKLEDAESVIELYIIEDSKTDLGIVQSLIDNWQEMFERIFDNLREYLNWQQTYDDKGDDNIHNKYLYFGKDGEPDCFDFKTLTKMLNEIGGERRADTADTDESRVSCKGECSFCGESIRSVQTNALADGRIMCARCAGLIVTDDSKLKELYADAVNYLSSEFGIVIPSDIKIRFATAESIRLQTRTGDQRTVLGFADPNNRELWVESDSPATNLSDALIHELTHFWQFDNIICEDMDYIEGQASYLEVQYLRKLGQENWANYVEAQLEQREDNYGIGYCKLKRELTERGDQNSFTYMKELFGN